MQAQLIINCVQCRRHLGDTFIDTADMPETLQAKINSVILAHRKGCRYYRAGTEARPRLLIKRGRA